MLAASGGAAVLAAGGGNPHIGTITVHLDHEVNRYAGDSPLGVGVDGHGLGEIAQIYRSKNLLAMRSAGFGPLTYRLRTELGGEAWHWNPRGSWSDPRRRTGYWTSAASGPRYAVSYGYRLPRRGNTIDQANNDGYSRLDDGDPRTFWKSDPYLDPHFTREPDRRHPQWVMVDLGRTWPVDAAQLDWADPFPKRLRLQYWVGGVPPWRNGAERENQIFASGLPPGRWHEFPRQPARNGGVERLRLAMRPVGARYLRVMLSASSHTHAPGARDIRDRVGYALRELRFGQLVNGRLRDYVRHASDHARQSIVWVSSTDPWHRATDRDPNIEQPSFDTVFNSGLAGAAPVLAPVALVYGTPGDAANELRFLRARGYPVEQLEMGEEPDGQLVGPEDYAALYAQFARALHAVAPTVTLGGPGFSTAIPDWTVPADAHGATSWTQRFLAELRAQNAVAQLGFFSFEWYPFDNVCQKPASQLTRAPQLLRDVIGRQRRAGLSPRLPMYITEYGFSPFATQAEMELAGALFDADTAADFLSLGGRVAYLYGLEPDAPIRESRYCATYGNLVLFQSDGQHRILHPVATYYAARLLTQQWLAADAGLERQYATLSDVRDGHGRALVTAYGVTRQDGRLSLLMINKDPRHPHTVRVRLARPGGVAGLPGSADVYQYSTAQYAWHPHGNHGYPGPDLPPSHTVAGASQALTITLPASSLSVLRTQTAPGH